MKKLTVRNLSHRTETSFVPKPPVGEIYIVDTVTENRVRKELCGQSDCLSTCGNDEYRVIGRNSNGYLVIEILK